MEKARVLASLKKGFEGKKRVGLRGEEKGICVCLVKKDENFMIYTTSVVSYN